MTTLTEFEDLRRKATSDFWDKVGRFIFLHDSAQTKFITQHKVFNDLAGAEKEAKAQEKEFSKEKEIVSK